MAPRIKRIQRLVLIIGMFMLIGFAIDFVVFNYLFSDPGRVGLRSMATRAALYAPLFLITYGFILKWFGVIDQFAWKTIALNIAKGIGFYCLVAIAILVVSSIVAWQLPHFRLPPVTLMVIAFCLFLGGAATEEVTYRGIIQPLFEKFMPAPLAAILQVSWFTMAHGLHQYANPVLAAASLFCAGMTYTIMARLDRQLYLSTACHLAHNFLLLALFGKSWQEVDFPPIWIESMRGFHGWLHLPAGIVTLLVWWYIYKKSTAVKL
jgi:membrane protease YdiL (CAAX protease family)